MAGLGEFLGGLMKKLPIQDRKERWKNQLEALEKEQERLNKGDPSVAKSKKYDANKLAIGKLNRLLKNSSDS